MHGQSLILISKNMFFTGWRKVLEHHGGRLPLRIRAVPEGSVVPVKNGRTLAILTLSLLTVSSPKLINNPKLQTG